MTSSTKTFFSFDHSNAPNRGARPADPTPTHLFFRSSFPSSVVLIGTHFFVKRGGNGEYFGPGEHRVLARSPLVGCFVFFFLIFGKRDWYS